MKPKSNQEMFKLVTIYRRVDDESALEQFFSRTHLPLAEKLPGLLKTEVSRITGKPGGQSRFYMMYELYFESREAYDAAMISDAGLRLIQALTPWWREKIIAWFFAESYTGDLAADRENLGESPPDAL